MCRRIIHHACGNALDERQHRRLQFAFEKLAALLKPFAPIVPLQAAEKSQRLLAETSVGGHRLIVRACGARKRLARKW